MNLNLLKDNLIRIGYKAELFSSKEDAVEYMASEIKGKSIGIGGSITAKEMGLGEALQKENKVFWHWDLTDMSTKEALKLAADTEIYISSVNAISENGEIVNIDGTCNRIASTLYGHEKVYFVVGKKKVEKTLEEAIHRARNVASPLNAKRLNKNTPCAKNCEENKCYDCSSPERICAAMTIFWRAPKGQEYEVILIDENLGY